MKTVKLALGFAALLGSAMPVLAADGATVGPNGEAPTPASSIALTPEQEAEIAKGGYTAALVWHEMSEYTSAVDRGAKEEFARPAILKSIRDNGSPCVKHFLV